MDFTILAVPGAALLTNIAGWLKNSLEDGEVQTYEWYQLGQTVIQTGIICAGLMLGFNLDAVSASAAAVLANVFLSSIKKIGKK